MFKRVGLITLCGLVISSVLVAIVPETGGAVQNPPLPTMPIIQAGATFDDIFPDDAFATIIASQFGRNTSDPVTQAELESITSLQIVNKQFSSAEGIGYLTGITHLRITENTLLLSLPDEIGHLGNLRSASLYDNAFSELPATVGYWVNLESISLYGGNETTLPPQIGNWTKLTYLDLDGAYPSGASPRTVGRLASIPEEICNILGLADVQLQNNVLPSIPKCLENLSSITRLDISNNLLTGGLPDFGFVSNYQNFDQTNSQEKTAIVGETLDAALFIPASFRQLMLAQGGSFLGEAKWVIVAESWTEEIIAYTGEELPLELLASPGKYTVSLTITNGDNRALNDSVFTTYLSIITMPAVPDTGVK